MADVSSYRSPQPSASHVRNIGLDIVITVLTCGLWNLYVQACQMRAVNEMIRQEKYSFWPWFLLTLITCGLYHIYHEFRMSSDILTARGKPADSQDAVLALVLAALGLSIVVDALQQSEINQFYGSNAL